MRHLYKALIRAQKEGKQLTPDLEKVVRFGSFSSGGGREKSAAVGALDIEAKISTNPNLHANPNPNPSLNPDPNPNSNPNPNPNSNPNPNTLEAFREALKTRIANRNAAVVPDPDREFETEEEKIAAEFRISEAGFVEALVFVGAEIRSRPFPRNYALTLTLTLTLTLNLLFVLSLALCCWWGTCWKDVQG